MQPLYGPDVAHCPSIAASPLASCWRCLILCGPQMPRGS
ncbi:hypothetical protein DVDV_0275 [Desulfovibrio sp. DV]|nr:hypothetical protein DVDV_0275 [Desulfovibrio sp. DV]